MGKWVFDKGYSNGMTPAAQQTIESAGTLFVCPQVMRLVPCRQNCRCDYPAQGFG